MNIPLGEPALLGNEARYLAECVETGMVSSIGGFVTRFELEFADLVGAEYAVACSTGTAALHVALRLVGVERGADVLVSDLTFIASVNAVAYLGARPVLVDADPRTWNLDPGLVSAELDRRRIAGEPMPAAIEVVHVLGQPADIEPIVAVAERYAVPVIEDAAEALGARYVGGPLDRRSVGTVGRIGAFSFNGNKILTTGGGGMVVTDDKELADRARHLVTQAKIPGIGYLHDEIGYNYRLTNIAAALGVAQLEQLPGFVRRKSEIARRYDAAFSGVPGLTCPPRLPWADASYWLYSILCGQSRTGSATRDLILDRLRSAEVDARPLWRPLHRQPPYADARRLGGPVSDDLFDRGISLPSSVSLTVADQDFVIRTVLEVLA
ncbi:LegC family aminotransferase [soil metagenome]|jgi:dTDP-4-amino-4,6-dideoxygalactose transaminase